MISIESVLGDQLKGLIDISSEENYIYFRIGDLIFLIWLSNCTKSHNKFYLFYR